MIVAGTFNLLTVCHNFISYRFFQFQFLYPFILEPLWMETNVEEQDVRALSGVCNAVYKDRMQGEELWNVEAEISPTVSPLSTREVQPDSDDISQKVFHCIFVILLEVFSAFFSHGFLMFSAAPKFLNSLFVSVLFTK